MLEKKDPIISTISKNGYYSSVDSAFELSKSNFAIALGVREKATDEFKSDPSIVRWEARVVEGDGVKRKEVL